MKLEDPELLRKPAPSYALTGPVREPYLYKSLYCRNMRCARCTMPTCECPCHAEAAKQLAHQLQEEGAVRKCYGMGCTNDVTHSNDLFCVDCNKGNTPKVRAAKAEAEATQLRMSRPL